MKATVTVPIRGWGNAWKVADSSDPADRVQARVVALEIQGDPKNGDHLIMNLEGCFTANIWHESIEDAQDTTNDPPSGLLTWRRR